MPIVFESDENIQKVGNVQNKRPNTSIENEYEAHPGDSEYEKLKKDVMNILNKIV